MLGPVRFHYGCHTRVGNHCFMNFNFTVQDDALAVSYTHLDVYKRQDRVCDLGCGAGALLLLLAARVSPLALSGVEYCPEDAALARRNLSENGLEGAIYTGDLRAVCKTLPLSLIHIYRVKHSV